MADDNLLSQQEADLATGGPENQPDGDSDGATNPYAQDVTPEPARRWGSGNENDLVPMLEQF